MCLELNLQCKVLETFKCFAQVVNREPKLFFFFFLENKGAIRIDH